MYQRYWSTGLTVDGMKQCVKLEKITLVFNDLIIDLNNFPNLKLIKSYGCNLDKVGVSKCKNIDWINSKILCFEECHDKKFIDDII